MHPVSGATVLMCIWMRLLAVFISFSISFAEASPPIVIDTLYSTLHSYETTGGVDPGLIVKTNPNVTFGPGPAIQDSVNSTDGGVTPTVIGIEILPRRVGQIMQGAGCGVTDSAGIVVQELRQKNETMYEEIMDLLFSQDAGIVEDGTGLSLSNTRSPLGASDFAQQEYALDDTTDCSPDRELTLFRIDQAQYLWQTHMDALKRNPNIEHFFAPWSAPAWMKTAVPGKRCSMIRGHLKAEYFAVHAEYMAKAMEAIQAKLGKTPFALSIQNEPMFLPRNYPGDKFTAAEAAHLGDLTRAALDAKGLQAVGLTAYDHNWDGWQWALDVLDNSTAFSSLSWHCYGGDARDQLRVSNAYPHLPVTLSECTVPLMGYRELWKNLREQTIRLLIDTIQYGSSRVTLWNCVLAATEDGFTSPSLPKTCDLCAAPILVYGLDSTTTTQASSSGVQRRKQSGPHHATGSSDVGLAVRRGTQEPLYFKLNADYVVLKHLQLATRSRTSSESNAIKIGSDTTEQKHNFEDGERVRVSAFKTPLGNAGQHRYSLIVLAKNDHFLTGKYENTTITIAFEGMVANVTLPCGLHTLSWVA